MINKFYETNIHEIGDAELRELLEALKQERANLPGAPVKTLNEMTAILMIVASEMSGRSSARLARYAIYIAVGSLVVSALGIFFR